MNKVELVTDGVGRRPDDRRVSGSPPSVGFSIRSGACTFPSKAPKKASLDSVLALVGSEANRGHDLLRSLGSPWRVIGGNLSREWLPSGSCLPSCLNGCSFFIDQAGGGGQKRCEGCSVSATFLRSVPLVERKSPSESSEARVRASCVVCAVKTPQRNFYSCPRQDDGRWGDARLPAARRDCSLPACVAESDV